MFGFKRKPDFSATMRLLDRNTELSLSIEGELESMVEDVTTVFDRRGEQTPATTGPGGIERRRHHRHDKTQPHIYHFHAR